MGGGAIGHFGAVDETTTRLIGRCIKVPWLKEETSDSEGASPVETKAKKRLLSVSQPSAMESSLSVMEVAAQHSKPGEETPSLKKEEEAKTAGNGNGSGNRSREDVIVKLEGVRLEDLDDSEATPVMETSLGVGKSPFEVEGEA